MLRQLGIFFLALCVLLLMPVWVVVLPIYQQVQSGRRRRAARSFTCVVCGELLGARSVKLADHKVRAEVRQRIHRSWGVLYRMRPRTLHAICPTCGARYTFRDASRTFVLEADALAGSSGRQ